MARCIGPPADWLPAVRRVTLRQLQETEPTGKQDRGPAKNQTPAPIPDATPSCETDVKLLLAFNPFQGDGYRGVSWFLSVVTSGIGNSLSYMVGHIATRRPWEMAS
jgi:hypothetical protein